MASILHVSKWKNTGIILRLMVVLAMLLSAFGFTVQPALAIGTIDQIRDPSPPNYIFNTAGQNENIWWKVTYETNLTPVRMTWRLFGPAPDDVSVGPQVGLTEETLIPGGLGLPPVDNGNGTFSIFNPENNVGNAVHGTNPANAHTVLITPDFAPGVYTSRVDFYSSAGLDSSSLITFNVRQPMLIFKYHDLNGNGTLDAGEPGLDDWVFTVTGPAGQEWSYTGNVAASPAPTTTVFAATGLTSRFPTSGASLLVNFVNVGAYTLAGDTFTLSVPMAAPPLPGHFISTVPTATFVSDTADGGFLDLPNGVLLAGEYTFVETLKSGWSNTDPGAVVPALTKTVNVPEDIADPETFMVIFGNQELGELEVFKFNDLDADGLFDVGEPPLSGWSFHITGPGGYDQTSLTNASGLITKENLIPGNYEVTETVQAGWTCTTLNPQTKSVTNGELTRYEFGNFRPLGSLQIFKFRDENGDGVYNPGDGDVALQGWDFVITGPSDYESSGTTDASGLILKGNLEPGPYTVTEIAKPDWVTTTLNPQTKDVVAGDTTFYEFGNMPLEHQVPASSTAGLWILIAGLGGAMALFVIRRARKSER